MKPDESEAVLTARIGAQTGKTAAELIAEMLTFYAEQRADGVDLEGDGDMLLFQFGVFDWGDGEKFELDITRQFLVPEDPDPDDDDEEFFGDAEPWQLNLTMRFAPTDELRALDGDEIWCHAPDGVDAFRSTIEASAAYQTLSQCVPDEVEISYDQC